MSSEPRDDFVLHVEEVDHRLVEALGPEVSAGLGVDELRIDANPVGAALHGAFEHIANAELLADLLQIQTLPLVSEGRVATDHLHAAHPRKVGGQALGHAVDEIFLLEVAADVREGEDHDGKSRRA